MDATYESYQHEPDTQIASKLALSRNLMAPYALIWDRCSAYLNNAQQLGYQSAKDDLTPQAAGKNKKKTTINQLLNIYRHVTAQLITNYPAVAVLPASAGSDDVEKSKCSEQALRYFWQAAKVKRTLRTYAQYLADWGTAGLRVRYNPGKKVVELLAVRPYDLRFEPYCNDPENSAWIGVVQYCTIEDIISQYPDHESEIREHATLAVRYYTYGPRSIPTDRYELIDVYHRDGRYEVWAGAACIFQTRTPEDVFPLAIARYTEVPGYLWGIGLLEPLLGLQDIYNATREQIQANIRLVGNPKILQPEEAEIKAGAWTDKVGVVKYKGGIEPKAFIVPPLSDMVLAEPGKILSEIYDLSGLSGTALGKRTMGVTSGKAIESTVASSAVQLQCTQDAIEESVADIAPVLLQYMAAYYDEAKNVRMLGPDGKIVFSEQHKTRFVNDPEIFIEAGSLFKDRIEDRDNKTMLWLQMGLIDKKQALKALSYHLGPTNLLEQIEGLQHARDVLQAVAVLGAPLRVYPSDDLESLEFVFGNYMREPTGDFYRLDPAHQDAVDQAYQQILAMMNPQAMAPAGQGQPVQPALPAPQQARGGGNVAPGMSGPAGALGSSAARPEVAPTDKAEVATSRGQ